jgi:hypothetical protein
MKDSGNIKDYRNKFLEIVSADKYNMLKFLYRKTLVYNRTISIVFSNLEKNKLWRPSEDFQSVSDEFVEEFISSCILNLIIEYDAGERDVLPIINTETLNTLSQLVEELNYVIDNNKDYIEDTLKYHILPKVNPESTDGIDRMFNISREKIDDLYTDIVRIDIYDIIGTFMSHNMSGFLEYVKGVIHPRKDRFSNVMKVFSEQADFYSKVIKTVRSEDSCIIFSSYYNVDMETSLNTLKVAVAELTLIYSNYGDIIQERYEKEFGMKIDTEAVPVHSEFENVQEEIVPEPSKEKSLSVEDISYSDDEEILFDDIVDTDINETDISDNDNNTDENSSDAGKFDEYIKDNSSDDEISEKENTAELSETEVIMNMNNSESINKLVKVIGSCYFCGGYDKFVTGLLSYTCHSMTSCKDEKVLENLKRWYRIIAQEVISDLSVEDDDIDYIVARMILIDFKSEFSKFSFDEIDSNEIFASDYFNDCLCSLVCSFNSDIPEFDNILDTMIDCLASIAKTSNAYARKFIAKELEKINYSSARKETPLEHFSNILKNGAAE